MLRVPNLSFPLGMQETDFGPVLCRRLRLKPKDILEVRVFRKSVDARDKGDVHFVLTLDVRLRDEERVLRSLKPGIAQRVQPVKEPPVSRPRFAQRPLVVGAGPAGLFAALELAQHGTRPILIERGKPVEDRAGDVEAMRDSGQLDPESNVQFGEGGAGAFSDGKLTTGIKSPFQRRVLETFVANGAPDEILILQKPHVGTDLLRGIVASIRREIIRLGGEVRFQTRLTGLVLDRAHVVGAEIMTPVGLQQISTDTVLLCIGHSARDTVQGLFNQGVRMTAKPFAAGVRIEHLQAMIDRSQYGSAAGHPALRPAEYKLHAPTPDGRGVYTFCMCPGGEVIAAASQEGGVVVNGMSLHARAGCNANAALLVGVRPEDFQDDHPLAGMVWQRSLEQAAWRIGGGDFRAPIQLVGDFLERRATRSVGHVQPTYRPGVTPCDLREVLPPWIADNLALGIRRLDQQLRGFAHPDAILTGVETRSSSPVRINRGPDGCAEGLDGLFPVGEGAGYAGGIVSAAVDGIVAARAAIERSALL